jgi:hypothetical protein
MGVVSNIDNSIILYNIFYVELILKNRLVKGECSIIYIHMVKTIFKPCGTLMIVTYHKIRQSMSATAYFNSTNPTVPIFLLPVILILSVFNNLILYSYIVLKHFNLAYKLISP